MDKDESFGEVIPEEALAEVEEMFDLFDKNKDGTIDLSEVESVFTALGQNPTPEELSQLLQKLLSSSPNEKSDFLTKEQFLELMVMYMGENAHRDLDREVFQVFDKNGDGLISKDELRQVFLGLGEDVAGEDLEAMFVQADTNGDGKIDYEEFKALFSEANK